MMEDIQAQEIVKIKEIIYRRKWWLIVPFVVVVLLMGIICIILPNIYQSTATILIESRQIPSDLVPSSVTSYAEQRIQSITQEVMSRNRILNLVKKYDLLPDKREKLTTDELVEKIRDRIKVEPINAEINENKFGRPIYLAIAFTVSYEDEDPKKAQMVTAELSSFFLEKNLEVREKLARQATKFLKQQLKEIKDQMRELESKIAKFRKEHIDELPEFTNLNMQKLEKINSDISNINMQIRSLKEQEASLRNRLASLDPYVGSSNRVLSPEERLQQARLEYAELVSKYSPKHPLVVAKKKELELLEKEAGVGENLKKMEEELQNLETEYANLKSRYSDKHPKVKGTKRQINELKKKIRELQKKLEENDKLLSKEPTNPAYISIKSDLDKIKVSIASLNQEKARLEKQREEIYKKLHAMPEVAKTYNELNNEYENLKLHYREVQQKLLTARLSEGAEEEQLGEKFKLIEPAFLPEEPVKPNRLALMLIGFVLGLGVSVGSAAIREYTDRTVKDPNTLQKLTQAPVLCIVPKIISPEEEKAIKKKRITIIAILCLLVIGGIAVFHFFVMDLYVFFAKLNRFIWKKTTF